METPDHTHESLFGQIIEFIDNEINNNIEECGIEAESESNSTVQPEPGTLPVQLNMNNLSMIATEEEFKENSDTQPTTSQSSQESVDRFVPAWLDLNTKRKNNVRQSTVTDASPVNTSCESQKVNLMPSYLDEKVVNEVVSQHAPEYKMNHPKRGKLIIFNHEKFEYQSSRKGTTFDVEAIESMGNKLHFDIAVHNDCKFAEIQDILHKISLEDHSENDCLCIFVLSHGERDCIYSQDIMYPPEVLWKPFTGDKCLTLAGKPKLIFIQACRGSLFDAGVKVTRTLARTETDAVSASYKIPTHADILVSHSSAPGFVSFRHTDQGSWYIQTLCQVLEKYYETMDLLKMLTITARKVALDYLSDNSENPFEDNRTQIPSLTSTLIRDVYFRPKN